MVVAGNSASAVAGTGGGIYVGAFQSLTMTNSIVRDNRGGGIRSNGYLTMRDSAVVGNDGRGIVVPFGYTTTALTVTQIDSSLIADNVSMGAGGGMASQLQAGDSMLIRSSTIRGNTADFGGGLWQDGFATMTIDRSLVVGNTAASKGGGLFDQGAVDVSNSTFSGNDGGGEGGAIETDPYREPAPHVLNIDASTIADNTAGVGSGIAVNFNYTATVGRSILADSPASGNCRVIGAGRSIRPAATSTAARAAGSRRPATCTAPTRASGRSRTTAARRRRSRCGRTARPSTRS